MKRARVRGFASLRYAVKYIMRRKILAPALQRPSSAEGSSNDINPYSLEYYIIHPGAKYINRADPSTMAAERVRVFVCRHIKRPGECN